VSMSGDEVFDPRDHNAEEDPSETLHDQGYYDDLFANDPVLALPADELSRHGSALTLSTLIINGVSWKYDQNEMVLAEDYGKDAVNP